MASLRDMFGTRTFPSPRRCVFPRWLSDPWSRGGYSYPGVGSDPEDQRRACPPAGRPCLFRRRGDRAGRIWHGARSTLVRRADRRGDLQGRDRHGVNVARRTGPGRRHGLAPAGTMAEVMVVMTKDSRMKLEEHPVRDGDRLRSRHARRAVRRADRHRPKRSRPTASRPARGSNKLMWWRVRLQLLTIVLILLWYLASRS